MRKVRGREIGAIFQDPLTSLNPLYTIGRQLVETIQAHLNMSAAQARTRAIDLLESTGIPGAAARIEHYPHQFSGGMRQRVVIALALAAEPKLIIADEPTTALDVSIQAQIIALLKALCREKGTAVMLVTHDMGVIAETADRVAVMYAGRIAEIGPVSDVIHRPQHPYTVGLMGSIPTIGQDRERLEQIDGAMPRLNAIPRGCAFNPRCRRVMPACHERRPELLPGRTSRAACWLHDASAGVPVRDRCSRDRGPRRAAGERARHHQGLRRLGALAQPGARRQGAATAARGRRCLASRSKRARRWHWWANRLRQVHRRRGCWSGCIAEPGRILFDGQDLSPFAQAQAQAQRRRMQMIFQEPYASLNPRWRVSGRRRADQRASA